MVIGETFHAADLARPLVLLVGTDPSTLRLTSDALEAHYRVETASRTSEAVTKACVLPVDLVVCDIDGPATRALEIVRSIREQTELDATPIVLLGNEADVELRSALLRRGANDYVVEPYTTEDLQIRIDNLLRTKQIFETCLSLEAELDTRRASPEAIAKQLHEAHEQLDAFTSSVANDFRTPLRAIDDFADSVEDERGEALDEEARRCFDRVRIAAGRVTALIDALVQLSRVAHAPLSLERVDLTVIARTVHEQLARSDASRSVALVVPDGLWAQGDRRLVTMLIEQLIGNAWKFTAGRDDAHIELGIEDGQDDVFYYIKDNGVGFDTKDANKLFAPFKTLHGSEYGGVGIGLAIAHRIVARHGGMIRVDGAEGTGATFRFSLGAFLG
ncbi:MAG: response regulator [Polyangiaceae bacterium]|nr:response regulator [Polyangiaceae bacterium]